VVKFYKVFLLCIIISLSAESRVTLDMTTLGSAGLSENESVYFTGQTSGQLSFEAMKNKNVKARLSLDTVSVNSDSAVSSSLSLGRAYIKARFPEFRIMMGKNRVNWAEGSFFNAGDIIFDSTSLAVDLTSDVIRDEALWLMQVNYPLGRFSFIEGIILPGAIVVDTESFSYTVPEAEVLKAGGRLYTVISDLKMESGYIFDGASEFTNHKFYGGLQGNMYIDYYASVSSAINKEKPDSEQLIDNLLISTGLYHVLDRGYDGKVTLRLESLIQPEAHNYLYLYPEIALTLDSGKSFQLRSVISPVDQKASASFIMSWNIYQGFTLISYTSASNLADSHTMNQTLGCRFIF